VPDLLRKLLEWFGDRPKTEIALIASAAIVLLVLISRVLYVIAAIVFLVALCGMIVQLVRRQSARAWVAATGVALGMTLLFGFVANTIYGPMIQGQVRAGTLLTAVIAFAGVVTGVAGIFTGFAANRQARAAENQASMTARSLRVTEQSLREQNDRAHLDLEMATLFKLDDRFFYGSRFLDARREAIEHITHTRISQKVCSQTTPIFRTCGRAPPVPRTYSTSSST
jgi:uncharacterized membrane protein (DUF441 family)